MYCHVFYYALSLGATSLRDQVGRKSMNMQRTSGLGWIRGSKEALYHAPGELRNPVRAGSAAATCGRGLAGAGCSRSYGRTPDSVSAQRHLQGHAGGSGRSPGGRGVRLACSSRGPRTHRRGYALLWIVAALLVTPALAYADLLTATIINEQHSVLEGSSAVFTVTLTGGTGSEPVVPRLHGKRYGGAGAGDGAGCDWGL